MDYGEAIEQLTKAKIEAYRMCGTANILEAFKQIEDERGEMLSLHDRNTAQALHIKRLDELLRTTNAIITEIEKNGMMFLPPSTKNMIAKYKAAWYENEAQLAEALKL